MQTREVVVIGAGVAGLACAQELRRAARDVVVLEARDRPGGRVSTLRTSDGEVIELGAQVIHANADPSLADLVKTSELATARLARDGILNVFRGGRMWSGSELIRPGYLAPWVVEHSLERLGAGTVAEALERLPDDSRADGVAWVEQVVGGDVSTLHVPGVVARREGRAGAEHVLTQGYDGVVGVLADELDLVLGKPVDLVSWSAEGVVVDAGKPTRARAVVVTVPPSVVLDEGLHFSPGLPADRLEALLALSSCDALCVVAVTARPASRSTWTLLVDSVGGLWRTSAGSCVVSGHVKGPGAALARRHGWGPSETSRIVALLDGSAGPVIDVHVVDWGSDPWARGAFSVPSEGSDQAASRWAAPLEDVLFFAGEATAPPASRGLVQGAISSGRRAAAEVLAALGHR